MYGCAHDGVPRRFHQTGIAYLGWRSDVPFCEFSVLILPSQVEPFGMVVPEALFTGVAVVMSSVVNASELPNLKRTAILDVEEPEKAWATAIIDLVWSERVFQRFHNWRDFANEYIRLYRRLI